MIKNPTARAKAKALGHKHYWTGNPCPSGHVAYRYTSSGTCVECLRLDVARKVKDGYFKSHYAKNSEQVLDRCREYAKRNRREVSRRAREWSQNNPRKRKAISKNYKAKRRSLEEAGISGAVLAAWTVEQPKVCFYCAVDCDEGFHVDHFIPLSKGGAHVLTNLRIACAPCNLRKNAKMPDEFMAEVARSRVNASMFAEAV